MRLARAQLVRRYVSDGVFGKGMEKVSGKIKICVSIGKRNLDEALAAAGEVAEQADVIEIRLDLLDRPAIAPFCAALATPLLFTNRAQWEGGAFSGGEKARVAFLEEAVAAKAAYVDLELLAPLDSWGRLTKAAARSGTKLICSWHNFEKTPGTSELHEKVEMMQASGGAIGKIVTMANDCCDVLRVLHLQERAVEVGFPLIAFCMGKPGIISRVATPALGGYMTYCAVNDGEVTAPGQVSLATLGKVYQLLGYR